MQPDLTSYLSEKIRYPRKVTHPCISPIFIIRLFDVIGTIKLYSQLMGSDKLGGSLGGSFVSDSCFIGSVEICPLNLSGCPQKRWSAVLASYSYPSWGENYSQFEKLETSDLGIKLTSKLWNSMQTFCGFFCQILCSN